MTTLIKGDVVLMRGHVTHVDTDEDRNIGIKLQGYYTTLYVNSKDLTFVHHTFKIGDRVRGHELGIHGTVLGIHDDYAWVEMDGGGTFLTLSLTGLELAPGEPAVDDAASDIPF